MAGHDPVHVDSKHYKVEFEDEKVRVLRARYGPGEKSSMHSHPALLAVMLTDAHIRFGYPDGKTEEMTASAGQVMSLPPTDHLPENLGDKVFECILVELKK
jgi:quercetin dioxygenase-like cupin family protein